MNVSAFTDENPAYLYSIYTKTSMAEDLEVKITPICDFRQMHNSAYFQMYQARVVPSASPFHKSAYYRIPADPHKATSNANHSLFYCWSTSPDSQKARITVLTECRKWYDKRVVTCQTQLRNAVERQQHIKQMLNIESHK